MRTTSFKLSNTQSSFIPFSHACLFRKPILHNIQDPFPCPPPQGFFLVKNDPFSRMRICYYGRKVLKMVYVPPSFLAVCPLLGDRQ